MTKYVALVDIWEQCSADYDAVHRTEVIDIDSTTTVGELMAHVSRWNLLGKGDVRIAEAKGTQ